MSLILMAPPTTGKRLGHDDMASVRPSQYVVFRGTDWPRLIGKGLGIFRRRWAERVNSRLCAEHATQGKFIDGLHRPSPEIR